MIWSHLKAREQQKSLRSHFQPAECFSSACNDRSRRQKQIRQMWRCFVRECRTTQTPQEQRDVLLTLNIFRSQFARNKMFVGHRKWGNDVCHFLKQVTFFPSVLQTTSLSLFMWTNIHVFTERRHLVPLCDGRVFTSEQVGSLLSSVTVRRHFVQTSFK